MFFLKEAMASPTAISILLIIVFVLFSFTACPDSSGDTDQGKGNADSGDKDSDFESSGETSQGTGSADKSDKSSNLNECCVLDDSDDYSSDNQSKEIKKGVTLSVEVAYELNDVTTDVEIEVSELISWDDTKITRTFSIK